MWAVFFFCRQDVSITIFGCTMDFSEVCGTSLMCNFGVRSRFLDVIYGVRPPNGSPVLTSTLPHSLLVSYAALDLSKTFLRKVLFFHPCKVKQLPVVQFLPVTLLQASNWLGKPLVLASDLLLLDTNCNIFGSSR